MKTTLSLDYSSILANEARAVNLALTFTAPNTVPARPEPVAFVLVLDRSGSMGGAPLAAAKQAAIAVVRNLRPGDWFGLVTFDAHAETLVPFADSRDQSTTIRTIEGIEPGGATNLTGGWSLGRDLLAGAPEQSPKKILLLTDGMANVGITEPDQITALAGQACERSRIRTSCLGFGDQYTEDLLRAMASASGGEQHDANDPEHLPAIFETELEGLQRIAVQNLRIRVTPTSCVDAYKLLGAYPPPIRRGKLREYAIGDLVSDEQRVVVLSLDVLPLPLLDDGKPVASWDGEKLLDLELCFDEITDWGVEIRREQRSVSVRPVQDPAEVKFDVEVIAWVSLQAAATCADRAIAMRDRGDTAGAQRVLQAEIDRLSQLPPSPVLADALDLLKRTLETVSEERGYNRGRKVMSNLIVECCKMSSHETRPQRSGAAPSFKRRPPPRPAAPEGEATPPTDEEGPQTGSA